MKALPKELEELIDEIRGWLFYGDQLEVAKRSRTDEARVSKMLSKKVTPTMKVLEAGVEVMNENKARLKIHSSTK